MIDYWVDDVSRPCQYRDIVVGNNVRQEQPGGEHQMGQLVAISDRHHHDYISPCPDRGSQKIIKLTSCIALKYTLFSIK